MAPLYISGSVSEIPAASEQTVAVALPKFTIPDKKYLDVQLMEKNGGRNLSIRINNRYLMKAKAM